MYKIDKLIKSGENLFHTNDLALLWQTANRNTLYTTIKRYTDKGILIPVQKGLYFTISGNQYISRRLKDECLFRNAGISEVNKVFIATTERALADTLYFDPKFHFDSNVNINLELLTKIQK